MQGKLNKKEIITIISIAVLLIIAIIGTVVFLKNRGTTEAIELSAQQQNQEQRQTSNSDTQTSISQDNQPNIAQENVQQEQQSEAIQPSDDTTQTGNTGDAGATDGTTIPTTGATTITSTGTTTSTSGIAIGNSQQNAEVDSIQETTITREEEGEERKVSDDRKVRWQPMALNSDIASARINAEKANIKIEKTAKTQTGENLVTAGENITYTLKVTNTGDKDVKQIDVTDKIGKNIIYVETDDNAERIKNENGEIIALRWKIDLKAKESVELTFEVQVKDEAEGTILNKAIANGEESEEVKTSIIKSEKTSILKRKCIEIEEPAEIGDEITYTISVKNTGEVSGKTIIKDDNLKSILEDGKATLVGDIKLYEGDVLKLSNITDKELIAGLKDINIPANNGEIKVVFTVKINKINGEIVNIGKIGKQEKPTNPERIETLNIDIQKEIKEIRRNNQVVSAPAMVDDIIYYNIKVKNTGSVDKEIQVSDIIENNKEELDLYYNNQVVTKIMLAKGEEKILTATYLVKQSDIDNQNETNNKINNIGKIKYNDTEKTDNAETLLVEKEPLIEVEKTATKINGNTVTKGEDGKLISTDEEGNVISRDTKVAKGDMITYTIKTTNTGNVTLKNIDVTDTLEITYNSNKIAPNTIIKTIDKLAPGESDTITVTYEVKQTDVDNLEKIANIAKSEAEDGTKDSDDDTTVPTDKTPLIEVEKTATKINGNTVTKEEDGKLISTDEEGNVISRDTKVAKGDMITYTIKTTNTGKVTLKNIDVIDTLEITYNGNKIAPNTIIKTIDKLAPGESDTITVTYEVKQTDVDNLEKIANIAKSEAEDGTKDSDEDTTVPTDKTPLIEVEKTATKINGNTVTKGEDGKLISTDEEGNVISRDTKVAKGDMITYTIKTTNTGKVTLKNIGVTDTLEITYNGNKIAPNIIIKTIDKLAPGESDTITVTYEVKQTDVDNLEKIANIAKSEAEDGTKDSDDDTTVPTDKTPSIDIIKEAKIIKIGATEATVKRNEEGNVITYITNAGDTIRYTITATNDSHRILENVNIYDQTHTVKVIKVQKGSYDFEPNDDANTVVAGGNLLGVLPEEHQKTLEPNESYVITIEYKVENIVNVQEIENIAIVLATAKNTGESVTDNDTEKVPVIQKIEPTIEKTSIKVGTTVINDENRNTVKLKQGDKVTYEIIVTNQGNKVLTDVAVTDDHKVTIGKIEKVNADGTRTEDTVLKRNATANNLLGKTILEPEEKYVITVSYIVTVKDTEINEEDPEKGDKLINYAYLDAKELEEKISDDDILTKYKESIITQTKTSTVIGKAENDSIVNTGDIIEYTITVSNTGNISGPTTVKDVLIKTNIENDKVVMMNGNTELNKAQSLITNCISVESNKGESTATNVNELASETGYPLSVDNGEIYTIKFRVKVGKLLPGETIVNKLENQENTNTQNDVEASITLNKELVSPQNTVIVIDLSLSMAEAVDYSGGADPMADTYEETRWYALTQALDKFLDTYMDGNNTVTIIGYNGNSTQEHELIANTTNKTAAKNSYSNILTREQFRKGDKSDVDSLSETGTKLASGTNIEAGLIKAQNILGTNINGAKVILMTDGEANRRIVNGNSVSCNTTQGINAANAQATTLKENGATLYTVSLSLGTANQEYITKLAQMASKDENGEHLSDSVENIEDLVKYFKKISESISEYHYTTTTKSGILYLSDAFSVDSRYVREIIVEIPNDETEQTITLSWSEFVTYYNSTSKTINVKQLAQDKGIKAITGNVSITINVDTVIQQ